MKIQFLQWTPRPFALVGFVLVLIWLGSGCAAIHETRTVGLPGLPPIASADAVKVFEHGRNGAPPYQIVGQITLYRQGTLLTTSAALKRMQRIAADMGASGLIEFEAVSTMADQLGTGLPGTGVFLYQGLAVKWLAPGEARQPLVKPFIIATTLLQDGETGASKTMWSANHRLVSALCKPLALKGYYAVPLETTNPPPSLEGVRSLTDHDLRATGGVDASLLLAIGIVSATKTVDAGLYAQAQTSVRTTLFDKASRSVLFQAEGTRILYNVGWLDVLTYANVRNYNSFVYAYLASLRDLKPIGEELSR